MLDVAPGRQSFRSFNHDIEVAHAVPRTLKRWPVLLTLYAGPGQCSGWRRRTGPISARGRPQQPQQQQQEWRRPR
jgi:hypothetical protein